MKMESWKFYSLAFLSILLFVSCSRLVTEPEALRAAQDRFSKVCAGSHYNPSSFTGPTKTTVGGAKFAYEWKESVVGSDFGVLITVDETGYTNVSSFGTLPKLRGYLKN